MDDVETDLVKRIAALDPQTVLALLASRAALQAEIERLRHDVERHMQIAADLESELTTASESAAREMRERCAGLADDEAIQWKGILASANKRAKNAELLSAVGYQGDPDAEVIEAQTGLNVSSELAATMRALPLTPTKEN